MSSGLGYYVYFVFSFVFVSHFPSIKWISGEEWFKGRGIMIDAGQCARASTTLGRLEQMKCAQKWFIFPLISIPSRRPSSVHNKGERRRRRRKRIRREGGEEGGKRKEGIKGRRRRLREGPLLPRVVIPPSRRREWGK